MFEKILQMNLLYDFYGQLLTKKQQQVLEYYYNDDYSLGEIAQQLTVSRQAVYDTIKRSEKLLFEYEKKLGLVQKFMINQNKMKQMMDRIENLEIQVLDSDKKDLMLHSILKIKKLLLDILEK